MNTNMMHSTRNGCGVSNNNNNNTDDDDYNDEYNDDDDYRLFGATCEVLDAISNNPMKTGAPLIICVRRLSRTFFHSFYKTTIEELKELSRQVTRGEGEIRHAFNC